MPTFEHNTLRQYKDQNGDMHLDYPITKAENVVGLYWDAALTGVPTAPTAEKGTNTEQVATTAFVQNAISGLGGSGGGTTSEDVNSNTVFMDDGSSVTTYEDGRVVYFCLCVPSSNLSSCDTIQNIFVVMGVACSCGSMDLCC